MTRTPILIALCSPAAQMGKSAVAERLVERHGFTRVRFAGPLKSMIFTMLCDAGIPEDMTYRYVDGDLKETVIPELGVTSRHLMQTLGTEWGRTCVREDLWVHLTRLRIQALLNCSEGHPVVVDDMRFINEMRLIEDLGGVTVRVVRPSVPIPLRTHASEGELDDIEMDHELINVEGLSYLHDRVDFLVQRLATATPPFVG